MTTPESEQPTGCRPVEGITHLRSPLSVAETVDRLVQEIGQAGAKLFAIFDQSGEAKRVGLSLRDTKLVVFGNPAAGTRVMEASPTSALDLPLRVLVWQNDDASVWMTYLEGEWLATRHSVPPGVAEPLGVVRTLTAKAAGA
jgi:uncharacterized protein (DUF302 family)